MNKILVTGALGHIGSRLIQELPSHFPEAEILMLDNLATQRYCSLFDLPPHGRYRFVEADILSGDLDPLVAGAGAVIHLAAITNAEGSFEIQEQVERTNLAGTERVARACVRNRVPLLFPSTTSVYGTQSRVVDEECTPDELRPQSPYASSKLGAERLLARLGEEEGLRYVICRFGTIFGPSPGMRFHTAVNKFIWQACNAIPLTVWNSALDQERPYLDLEDAVRAVSFILEQELYDNRIYNVLTLNATVRQVVDTLAGFVPDLRVSLVEHRIMNQLSYTVSNARFASLGFSFEGDLGRRMGETVALLAGVRTW